MHYYILITFFLYKLLLFINLLNILKLVFHK